MQIGCQVAGITQSNSNDQRPCGKTYQSSSSEEMWKNSENIPKGFMVRSVCALTSIWTIAQLRLRFKQNQVAELSNRSLSACCRYQGQVVPGSIPEK
jgi:hypothetical protein